MARGRRRAPRKRRMGGTTSCSPGQVMRGGRCVSSGYQRGGKIQSRKRRRGGRVRKFQAGGHTHALEVEVKHLFIAREETDFIRDPCIQ